MRDVDADYYGYRDDDDGLLMPLEQEAEKEGLLSMCIRKTSRLTGLTSQHCRELRIGQTVNEVGFIGGNIG